MTTNTVTDANGKPVAITRVESVEWIAGDEWQTLWGARVVGRARIDLAGGGQLHGIVISLPPLGEKRVAMWWDRYTNRFVTSELTP